MNDLKTKFLILLFAPALLMSSCRLTAKRPASSYPEAKLNWKMALQNSTYRRFTFFESAGKADSCGLKYLEAYTDQDIGGGIEGKTDYHMTAAKRKLILDMLKAKGMQLVSYGVVSPRTEADWVKLFDFGKAMGIETFTSEPDEKDLPLVSRLCDEYKINVAIHNHAKPSHYWNPDILLAAIKGQSSRVGACADIGHWQRSGLDPLTCLKKLDGHMLSAHMKDLNGSDMTAHDVQWGKGAANIKGIIKELKRQNFAGVIAAEYEYNREKTWYSSVPDIKASVAYFRESLK